MTALRAWGEMHVEILLSIVSIEGGKCVAILDGRRFEFRAGDIVNLNGTASFTPNDDLIVNARMGDVIDASLDGGSERALGRGRRLLGRGTP